MAPYRRVKESADALAEIHSLEDEEVVAALAAAAAENDPYLANVLTTEAQNRLSQRGTTLRTMAEGVLSVGPMGLVSGINPAAEKMLGWSPEEALGSELDSILSCRLRGAGGKWRDCSLGSEVLQGEGTTREEDGFFRRRDGTWLSVAFSSAPILRENDNWGWVVVFRDTTERRRSEEAVRRLAAIVEASDDIILSLALDGTILTWNPRAEVLYGYSAAEAIGKRVSLVVPPELADSVKRVLALVGSGEAIHQYETQRIQRGGTVIEISLTASPIRNEAGEVIAVSWVGHDITESKRVETALRHSEERYRLLLDSATDHAIFQLDPQGHVVSWSPAAERMKGWKEEEILGWHYSVLFPPEKVQEGAPWQELSEAARRGRFSAEDLRMRKDGRLFIASVTLSAMRDETGDLVGFVKVTRDVTERVEWERRLKAGEARYKVLFDLNPKPIAWCDTDLQIRRVNDGLKRLLGFDESELLGEPLDAYLTGVGATSLLDAVEKAGGALVEVLVQRKDGSSLPMACRIVPIDVEDKRVGFYAIGDSM